MLSTTLPEPATEPSVRAALRSPRLLQTEVLGGLVVALALIPEAISFSIIAGVDPRVGLFASFTMAVTIAFVGGRPAMISAATGAIALVIAPLVRDHGVDYLVAAVILAGVIQVLLGAARRRQADAVRPALGDGRLRQRAGDPDLPRPGAELHRRAVAGLPAGRGRPADHLRPAAAHHGGPGAAGRDRRADRRHGRWPRIDVPTVGDKGELPDSLPVARSCPTCRSRWRPCTIIAPYALAMALVGLLESLMTAKLVDDITDTHSDKTREALGPGRRQHRHRLLRRHGRLRDDRPDDDQREGLRRPHPDLHVPGRRRSCWSWSSGSATSSPLIPMAALVAVMIMVSVGDLRLAQHPPRRRCAGCRGRDRRHGRHRGRHRRHPQPRHRRRSSASLVAMVAVRPPGRPPRRGRPRSSTRTAAHRRLPRHRRAVLRLQQRPRTPSSTTPATPTGWSSTCPASHVWDASTVAALDAITTKYRRRARPSRSPA